MCKHVIMTSFIVHCFVQCIKNQYDVRISFFQSFQIIALKMALCQISSQAMFTLYRIGFCSVSKVAPVQCEQELMFRCGAEIVPKRSQCEHKPYPLCNLQRFLLI